MHLTQKALPQMRLSLSVNPPLQISCLHRFWVLKFLLQKEQSVSTNCPSFASTFSTSGGGMENAVDHDASLLLFCSVILVLVLPPLLLSTTLSSPSPSPPLLFLLLPSSPLVFFVIASSSPLPSSSNFSSPRGPKAITSESSSSYSLLSSASYLSSFLSNF